MPEARVVRAGQCAEPNGSNTRCAAIDATVGRVREKTTPRATTKIATETSHHVLRALRSPLNETVLARDCASAMDCCARILSFPEWAIARSTALASRPSTPGLWRSILSAICTSDGLNFNAGQTLCTNAQNSARSPPIRSTNRSRSGNLNTKSSKPIAVMNTIAPTTTRAICACTSSLRADARKLLSR